MQAHDLRELAALAYKCAYEVDPLDYRWAYLLGEIDPQDEIIWYRRSLEASEAVHGGYYRMGMAFFNRMRLTEAITLFDKLIKTPVYAAYAGESFPALLNFFLQDDVMTDWLHFVGNVLMFVLRFGKLLKKMKED